MLSFCPQCTTTLGLVHFFFFFFSNHLREREIFSCQIWMPKEKKRQGLRRPRIWGWGWRRDDVRRRQSPQGMGVKWGKRSDAMMKVTTSRHGIGIRQSLKGQVWKVVIPIFCQCLSSINLNQEFSLNYLNCGRPTT